MIYYVIKKDGLYYNEIGVGYDTFSPWGSLFPAHNIDYVWTNLWPEDRVGAEIYQINIQETDIRYTPQPVKEDKDIGF